MVNYSHILFPDFRFRGRSEFKSEYFYVEVRYLWRVLQASINKIPFCDCWNDFE